VHFKYQLPNFIICVHLCSSVANDPPHLWLSCP